MTRAESGDPNDLVLLKHWLVEKMPPTERNGLVFVDDSQGHGSLNAMVTEFSAWGQAFAPAHVGFQYGYQSDKRWWSDYGGSSTGDRQRPVVGNPEHAGSRLGGLHRIRHLAARVVTRIGATPSWGGSGGRIRTYDQAVNSRPLYH